MNSQFSNLHNNSGSQNLDAIALVRMVLSVLGSNQELKSLFKDEISYFEDQLKFWDNDTLRLGVIGVTSSGKSTLLNSLLGRQLLPAVAKPSSSQLVACRKGKNFSATVKFKNGTSKTFSNNNLTPQVISSYGDEQYNPHNTKGVEIIEITSPLLETDPSIIIEDSPGLDAYGLDEHEKITMNTLLPSIDFCIFVTTCKTNSDRKTKDVLNEIGRYGKPVIIVQNMIDSLKPSLDGKKSVDVVAQEHINRLKRIIDESNIRNESVEIIHYSALWALNSRTHKYQQEYYQNKSNYKELCNVINNVFKSLKPVIENNRKSNIRKELIEIVKRIPTGSVMQIISPPFEFEQEKRQLSMITDNCISRIRSITAELYNLESICQTRQVTQSLIEEIKKADRDASDSLADNISRYNKAIERLCNILNVSSRDFYNRIKSSSYARTLTSYKKAETYEVKKSGFWNSVKRFWGVGGYETKSRMVEDYARNRVEALKFIKDSYTDINFRTKEWIKNALLTKDKFYELIDRKKRQYDEAVRQQKNKEFSQAKKNFIRNELQKIITKIHLNSTFSGNGQKYSHSIKSSLTQITINAITFKNYIISRNFLNIMQLQLSKKLYKHRCIHIYSWDKESTERFLSYNFNLNTFDTDAMSVKSGFQIKTFQNPAVLDYQSRSLSTVIIMVNASQIGNAKKQIKPLLDSSIKGRTYLVIQDLEETARGGDLKGAVRDLRTFMLNSGFNKEDFNILVSDKNPVFNIVLAEIIKNPINNHKKEIDLLANVRLHFNYLYGDQTENRLSELIRSTYE